MSETRLDNSPKAAVSDAAIVRRAHKRWEKCNKWYSTANFNWDADYKFANGDSYNNYQWLDTMVKARGDRPTLTVNEVRQFNLHIINEAKQNKAQVKYRPTGDGATAEAAEVYEGIYRHIQNISNGQMVRGKAIEFQVQAGKGYTRVNSRFIRQKSFDQDVILQSIPNPRSVMLDCDAREVDKSDARYGFIFTDRPKDEVIEEYPDMEDRLPRDNAVDSGSTSWIREDYIREAEYYEVTEDKDELLGNSEGVTIFASEATPDLIKRWEAEEDAKGETLRRRPIIRKKVMWYKIIGDMIKDREQVPGTSVPIIPYVGEETIINQVYDCKGHTRALISAQQMENYNWSANVEFGALQTKVPWLIPAAAMGGFIGYWRTANTENHAFLPWVHIDDQGKPIPPPTRAEPPSSAPAYLEGVEMARQFMQAASGQHEADLGEQGNERSGKAINARQRMGDRATYGFIDNQGLAIRREGQIILEWIKEIYDTKRVLRIIGEDDEEQHVQNDPNSPEAHQIQEINGAVVRIFNPNVGDYEVVTDVGPDYATQRQEAFNAIAQILTQAPALVEKIGDLLFKVADFPLADQIAERLKPGMDPQAQKAITDLQTQLANKNRLLGEAMQALTEERLKVKAKDADNTVEAFDADTRRLGVVKDMLPLDPGAMQALIRETVVQALQDNLGPIVGSLQQAVISDISAEGPPGATGALPIVTPDVGQEAAQPGGA